MIIVDPFEPVSPEEVKSYAFDFTDYLSVGDTLATAVWSAETVSGSDPTPMNILTGVANVAPLMTAHYISNAKADVVYKLIAVCVTTLGETLELVGLLSCIAGV